MAGAGLRLGHLFAGEGERGLLLYGGKSPQRIRRRFTLRRFRKYFSTQRSEGQSKNTSGPFSCLGMPWHLTRRGC
jgi:hypothetical protein